MYYALVSCDSLSGYNEEYHVFGSEGVYFGRFLQISWISILPASTEYSVFFIPPGSIINACPALRPTLCQRCVVGRDPGGGGLIVDDRS